MLPYPINLLLLVSSLVTAAPAPQDITTYNPTKEASCLVKWDIQTQSDTTEHYEVTGQCMFLDSVDKVCSGGYRAPGFCPDENNRAVNCCIRHRCGKNFAGICINSDIPIDPSVKTHYSLLQDSACPSFRGAPAACYTSIAASLLPPGSQPVRIIGLDGSSPLPAQAEGQIPQQPMPNALSFNTDNNNNDNDNNNLNLWTIPTTGADFNNDGVGVQGGGGGGGGGGIQQQQDVGFSLFNQEQQKPAAVLKVAANGEGPTTSDDGFAFLDDDNQPSRLSSAGANGDARDGIIDFDGIAG